VHGGEQRNGMDSGITDLDDDARDVRQRGVRDVANEADGGRANQQAPENRTARRWFFAAISVVWSSPPLRQFLSDGLPAHGHDQAGLQLPAQSGRHQGRQQEVRLALDPADLPLARDHYIG
jgi:hypothetical protein